MQNRTQLQEFSSVSGGVKTEQLHEHIQRTTAVPLSARGKYDSSIPMTNVKVARR